LQNYHTLSRVDEEKMEKEKIKVRKKKNKCEIERRDLVCF
jgi:hypothetical protein